MALVSLHWSSLLDLYTPTYPKNKQALSFSSLLRFIDFFFFYFLRFSEARIEDTVTLSAENKNFSASEINRSKIKSVFKENGYEINEVQATSRDSRGRKFHDTAIILSRPKAPCSEAANEISEMKAQLQMAIEDQKSGMNCVYKHH